jgi:uncharacterized membrane protein
LPDPPADPHYARWQRGAVALVGALVLLELLWELLLAPLRPGGSWLALKALPLAAVWPGVARGSRRSRQVTLFLLLAYFAEGIVRALTESGRHAVVAWMATTLAAAAFAALLLSLRSGASFRTGGDG